MTVINIYRYILWQFKQSKHTINVDTLKFCKFISRQKLIYFSHLVQYSRELKS